MSQYLIDSIISWLEKKPKQKIWKFDFLKSSDSVIHGELEEEKQWVVSVYHNADNNTNR